MLMSRSLEISETSHRRCRTNAKLHTKIIHQTPPTSRIEYQMCEAGTKSKQALLDCIQRSDCLLAENRRIESQNCFEI